VLVHAMGGIWEGTLCLARSGVSEGRRYGIPYDQLIAKVELVTGEALTHGSFPRLREGHWVLQTSGPEPGEVLGWLTEALRKHGGDTAGLLPIGFLF
jgi:hypothetical protein